MPIRPIRGSDHSYALIAFDKNGVERSEIAGLLSDGLAMPDGGVTDLFVEVHGWKGDMPAAIDQYDRWFAALAARAAAATDIAAKRPAGFRPLFIGLHWPSLPWGEEEAGGAFGFGGDADAAQVEAYVQRLGGDEALRAPISLVFSTLANDPSPDVLSPEIMAAYRAIEARLGLASEGPQAPPGHDQPAFDPEATYQESRKADFGFGDGFSLGGLLAPLRQLSFWSMKKRARVVAEEGFHPLLEKLAARIGPKARIHIMGHSFGCIAACATIVGPADAAPVPVHSLVLVQGALSLWAFCGKLPFGHETGGYFHRLLTSDALKGPIVTTRSHFDRAIGHWYPLGAGIADQIGLGVEEFPRFGGFGSFGAQGLGTGAIDRPMLTSGQPYDFPAAGTVLNLEASAFICKGDDASGAHSDIDGPEVAHMTWSAAIA